MSVKYTLREQLVQKGLATVSNTPTNGLFLAGGMGLQLYVFDVYPNLLRPTNDADFSGVNPLRSDSFDALYQKFVQV